MWSFLRVDVASSSLSCMQGLVGILAFSLSSLSLQPSFLWAWRRFRFCCLSPRPQIPWAWLHHMERRTPPDLEQQPKRRKCRLAKTMSVWSPVSAQILQKLSLQQGAAPPRPATSVSVMVSRHTAAARWLKIPQVAHRAFDTDSWRWCLHNVLGVCD